MPPANTFTITALPGTDIWRKPPTTDIFNAPTALPPTVSSSPTPLRTTGPLTSFLSARLSLTFAPTQQYDQGGLLLSLRRRRSTTATPNHPPPPEKWIKTGIELYNSRPRLSTVACDRWADWSVSDLPSSSSSSSGAGQETGWTTLLVEKDKDGNGTGVWVHRVLEGGEKVPLREICWVFGGAEEELGEWEVEVSAMAARPAKEGAEGLEVQFGGLEVRWLD